MDQETANLITCGKYKGPVSARDHKEALSMAGNPPDHFILCAEAWAKELRDQYTNSMQRVPITPTVNMFGPFWSPPYPGGAGEPLTPAETKPPPPAQCSKCKEPFPYEAHESGKCYRCRNET